MRLEAGQVAVVTGAASGIGRGLAEGFLRRGLAVVAADIEAAALDAGGERDVDAGGRVIGQVTDVRDPDALLRLATRTTDDFGRVDVVVQQRRRHHATTAGVGAVARGLAVDPRGQPPRRRQRHPGVRAAPDPAGEGARRQHRLDRRSGAGTRWGQRRLHRLEARGRRAVGDAGRGAGHDRRRHRRHRAVPRAGPEPDPQRRAQPSRRARRPVPRAWARCRHRTSSSPSSRWTPRRWRTRCARRSRTAGATSCRDRGRRRWRGRGSTGCWPTWPEGSGEFGHMRAPRRGTRDAGRRSGERGPR